MWIPHLGASWLRRHTLCRLGLHGALRTYVPVWADTPRACWWARERCPCCGVTMSEVLVLAREVPEQVRRGFEEA